MHKPALVAALVALAWLGGCSRAGSGDPGEALLDHLVALAEVAEARGDDCQAALGAVQAYLGEHRAEIEALKAALVERTRAQAPEERARQTERFKAHAEERMTRTMASLMALGTRCPAQVPELEQAMSFADIAP
ncbi:MAG TPA: hypothetical protein PK668_05605 [Myxococcota bacterium]|nr:hypothetical protein [Myxococcota bacterium]HRY92684.1 hypothetical protein [Myxococcota bacterium]HSA24117.1 hypothetical protein [Myxococcota bacterium]